MTSRGFQRSCNNPPCSSMTGRRANQIHHLTPDFSLRELLPPKKAGTWADCVSPPCGERDRCEGWADRHTACSSPASPPQHRAKSFKKDLGHCLFLREERPACAPRLTGPV
nr:effector cell proteinase receptor 1 splice form 1b - human [Homo sapiens]